MEWKDELMMLIESYDEAKVNDKITLFISDLKKFVKKIVPAIGFINDLISSFKNIIVVSNLKFLYKNIKEFMLIKSEKRIEFVNFSTFEKMKLNDSVVIGIFNEDEEIIGKVIEKCKEEKAYLIGIINGKGEEISLYDKGIPIELRKRDFFTHYFLSLALLWILIKVVQNESEVSYIIEEYKKVPFYLEKIDNNEKLNESLFKLAKIIKENDNFFIFSNVNYCKLLFETFYKIARINIICLPNELVELNVNGIKIAIKEKGKMYKDVIVLDIESYLKKFGEDEYNLISPYLYYFLLFKLFYFISLLKYKKTV